MPRTAKPQANRTDLNVPGPTAAPAPGQGQPNGQPVQVPTNLPYGENQQLQQAQQAVPLPQGPQQQPLDMGAAMMAAKQFQKPNLPGLTGPTTRPNEPVTAGLPGSPINPAAGQRQVGNLSSMLSAVAQANNNPALSQLAARAAAAGQ